MWAILTLNASGFPCGVSLAIRIDEACGLLVLIVVVGKHVGVVGDTAAERDGTGVVGGGFGAVDEIEPVGLRCHCRIMRD